MSERTGCDVNGGAENQVLNNEACAYGFMNKMETRYCSPSRGVLGMSSRVLVEL